MTHPSPNSIVLESLAEGIPVIANGCHQIYLERCLFCLDVAGHNTGVNLDVGIDDHGITSESSFVLEWSSTIDDALRKRHADLWSSTEDSACAIAFLILREQTGYTAVEQANRGSTVDYYLSDKGRNDDLIFNNTARLEVSGILSGSDREIAARVKSKLQRLKDSDLPVYVIVVEHGKPVAKVVVRS